MTRAAKFLLGGGLLAAIVLAARAPSTDVSSDYEGRPEIVAATFASIWCSACRILEPKLATVLPDFADAPIAFIAYDLSFGDKPDLRALAERYDMADLYERYKGATGFTLLVDRDTGEIVDTLTINFSEKAMRAAIKRALAHAAHTRPAFFAEDAQSMVDE